MDLKELLEKREKAIELRKEKELIEITLESYKDTTFILKTPSSESLLNFLQKIGIKDFSVGEEKLAEIFSKKILLKTSEVPMYEFLFDSFVDPDLNEFAGELMAELNAKSKTEILKDFFSQEEIIRILGLVVQRIGENFNDSQNEQVVKLKKK